MARQPDKETIAGFSKGLRVIEAFDAGRPRLTITEVAQSTGLERATARRCLLTLVRDGYASYDGKFFSLAPRVLRLGYAYLSSTPLPRLVQPFLEHLATATSESCSASTLDGVDIVYVARASQKRVMSIGLSVGSRLPAYCSSMGRVLLAALPEKERSAMLAASALRRLTPRTIVDPGELAAAIETARRNGYAIVDQELEIGLRAIAVPLLDASGKVVAAINVGAQAERVSPEQMRREFLPKMRAVQSELSRLLV
jgi:IclR family pca regulon transcriptional regulator